MTVGIQYRRSKSLGDGRRLNVSKSGLSVSQRVGPLTLNSRGRGYLRLAPGLSFRFGKKDAGTVALVMLAVYLVVLVLDVVVAVVRVVLVVALWLVRWAWFGAVGFIEQRRETQG